MEKLLHNYLIRQCSLAPGIVVSESTPLQKVIATMQKEKVGCIVTSSAGNSCDERSIRGIFTERDLLERVVDEKVDWEAPISKFTTPSPVALHADEPLRKALYLMRKRNFRHIPIFLKENGKLCGVLSVRNVIRLFAEHFPVEVMNLPPKLHHYPDTAEGG